MPSNYIVGIVTDTLTHSTIEVSSAIGTMLNLDGGFDAHSDGDVMCKQTLKVYSHS